MAVKSIIEIDLKDGGFKSFAALYDKYQKALASSPGEWAKVTAGIGRSRKEFDQLVKQQIAVAARAKLVAEAQKQAETATRTTADRWRDLSRSTRDVAGNITRATAQLLRWGAITGVVSGLVGAGGLFGIDRLALNVSAARRSALGLGVGYGEQKAFGANFGRLVDAESFLSNVAGAKLDVTRRTGLIGAGLSNAEINGSTADTGVALLRNLKRLADNTDPSLYAQTLNARQLGQFASPEDLQRLRNTSPQEIAELVKAYRENRGSFGLSEATAKAWQDFTTQMTRAGQGIENTFVKGLAPLAPGLTKLSESFEKTVRAFLGSPTIEKWMKEIGGALEDFAKIVGTPEFEKSVRDFAAGLGVLVKGIGDAVKWFAKGPEQAETASDMHAGAGGEVPDSPGQQWANGWINYALGKRANRHNPGNLRLPGQSSGFAAFPSDEAGLRAMARQLRIYQNRDHLDTITGIVSKYAPPSENDTAAYIKDVSQRTGFAPNQHLDLSDNATLAQLIAAMTKHENSKSNYSPKVVVEVLNNTGGSAIVTTNQVAH